MEEFEGALNFFVLEVIQNVLQAQNNAGKRRSLHRILIPALFQ